MRKTLWILALVLVSSAIYTAIVVPLTVPPGHIGIIHSDAFGPGEAIVDSSGAHLVWSRLIPGDTRIHIFPEGRRLTRRSIRIVLPPGNLPGQTNTNDFSCVLDCSIGYTVVRTALPALLKAGVTNADVILTRLADRIEPVIRHALIRETETALLAEQPPRLVSASQTALSNEAAPQANAWLAGFGLPPAEISISWKTLPDPTAYMRMRLAIAQAIHGLTEQIRDWHRVGAKISRDTRTSARERDSLRDIAKLVHEYPKVLEYLAITGLSDKIRLVVLPSGNSVPMAEQLWPDVLDVVRQSLRLATESAGTNRSTLATNAGTRGK